MRVAIICDTFPPFKSSAAIQMGDLAQGFVDNNFDTSVFVPDSSINSSYQHSVKQGVNIFRIKSPNLKNISFYKRAINELILPFTLIKNIFFSNINKREFDLIIWYSPSIFLWPFALYLKTLNKCPSYLILRDIFPNWALDLGLMKKGIPYFFFKFIEYFQYLVADKIGVQTISNLNYFQGILKPIAKKTEVLNNWLTKYDDKDIEKKLDFKLPEEKKILIYSGNMGKAQNLKIWLDLANKNEQKYFFIFIGRGSERKILESIAEKNKSKNVLFLNELDKENLNSLYKLCDIGIISLNIEHKLNNIPGKLLSYLQASLPVIAAINPNNDLKDIILKYQIGEFIESNSIDELDEKLSSLFKKIETDKNIKIRCKNLWKNQFSTQIAVDQIKKEIVL